MLRISLIYLLVFSTSLMAKDKDSGRAGNGGDVVVCPNQPVQVLDFYEANMVRARDGKYKAVIAVEKLSAEDFKTVLVKRLKDLKDSYGSGHGYNKLANEVAKAWDSIGPVDTWNVKEIKDINDSKESYTLTDGCELKQAVNRFGTRLEIDPSIKSLLSQGQKNMLRAHEAIYFVGTQFYNHHYSINTRQLERELLQKIVDVEKLRVSADAFIKNSQDVYTDFLVNPARYQGQYILIDIEKIREDKALISINYKGECPTEIKVNSVGEDIGLIFSMKFHFSKNLSAAKGGLKIFAPYNETYFLLKEQGAVDLNYYYEGEKFSLTFDDRDAIEGFGVVILRSNFTGKSNCIFMKTTTNK